MEIGPWRMNDHGGLDVAEGGWEEYTNIVYGPSSSFGLSFISGHADTPHLKPPVQWINLLGQDTRTQARTASCMNSQMFVFFTFSHCLVCGRMLTSERGSYRHQTNS